ncbi:MAG: PLP-dependent aminotransferase family protein [Alphaproteobacteria bacterium]|nr:PLP-dependent aminotransferase family protein [Alphaproteobacteria bacterium]
MTIWAPRIEDFPGPRYQAIAEAIALAIREGELKAGDRLPPVRDLAYRLGLTVGTVNRGYMLAEARGQVSGEVGRGTYVREQPRPMMKFPDPPDGEGDNLLDMGDAALNLTRNVPVGEQISDAVIATLHKVAESCARERALPHSFLSYGEPAGTLRYRAAGAHWLRRTGIEVPPERVVVTGGAQQALAAALGALAAPGERILCERLTYAGLLHAARLYHLQPEGLPMDEEGLLPESLEAACREGGVRILCLVPTMQNPTTSIMGLARRRKIVEIARRHELIIIEDDVYGILPTDRPPPIATLAPERTIHVASASKCLTPGMRMGWLAAPAVHVERLIDAMYAMSIALPTLPLEMITRWIEDGTAEKLIAMQREECAARHEIAARHLQGLEYRSHPHCFHVWLQLPEPWRAQEFVQAAARRGILLLAAGHFAVGRAPAPHAVRISIGAAPSRERLAQALRDVAELAGSGTGVRRGII